MTVMQVTVNNLKVQFAFESSATLLFSEGNSYSMLYFFRSSYSMLKTAAFSL